MRGSITIKTAGLTCRFVNIGADTLFSTWEDKADPWRVEETAAPDLTVENAPVAYDLTGAALLAEDTDGHYAHRVYRSAEGKEYRNFEGRGGKVYLCYEADLKQGKLLLREDNTGTAGAFAFEYAGRIIPELLLGRSVMTMHGVLMEYRGEGLILTADSGVGKTTHARLWRDAKNAFIINGDRVSLKRELPGWRGYGLPWSGSSGEQMKRSVPVRAIVQIVRGEENRAERLGGTEAFSVVLGQLLTPAWEPETAAKAVDMAAALTEETPVWRLHCRPEAEAAEVLAQAIFGAKA